MTFYGTFATGAGWIVPKKYMEQVGPDGFQKHPIGLGPYKFVSHKPGIELVMEAYEGYWRKMPSRQAPGLQERPGGHHAAGHAQARRGGSRVPARRAAGPGGEARSESEARVLGRHRHRSTSTSSSSGTRSRRGTTSACGWPRASRSTARRISEAETLGASQAERQRRAAGVRVRAAARARIPTIPAQAKKLLAEAGYPNGFDARRSVPLAALHLDRRGGRQLPRRGRHQDADARPWSAPRSTPRWARRSSRGSACA